MKGGSLGRLIHELIISMLTLSQWCCVLVVLGQLHHLRPGRWVLQAKTKMVHQYFNSSQRGGTQFAFTSIDLAEHEVSLLFISCNELLILDCFTLIVEERDNNFELAR